MPDAIVTQAVERLKLATEAEKEQRLREKEDLSFQVPEKQWTPEARQSRSAQQVNGVTLPARPMLAIPKLDQPVQLVLNQEKAAHLGVQVHPLSEDADDDTAEVFQGLYRCIERDSRANLARSWGFERAVKAGRGAYRVLTEPAEGYGVTKDQRIVIKRLLYQDSAYFDPFAIEPDWSDGEWAFVVAWVSWAKYKRLYSKKKSKAGADVDSELAGYNDGELASLVSNDICPAWIKGDGESRAVLVAEYFTVEGTEDDRRIIWRKLNGIEVLEEQVWMGKYIPIIPVIGRELIPFDDERRWVGIIGPNKDGQRFFNYSASTVVENMATEPKNTWVLAEGQEEGHEQEFLLANVRNFPYVRYKPTSLAGNLNPPPYRSQVDTSKLALAMQGLTVASEFIHAGTGAFEPSLGQNSPNVKTKGATLALQQQHDEGNSNWMDNLKEITLTYEAKVVLDLIPKVYDRPGRIARILDFEDKSEMVMLNAPFVIDPQTKRPMPAPQAPPSQSSPMAQQQPGAMSAQQPKQPEAKHYDLTKGIYGVSVNIGKAYKSRLDEGNDALGNLFQAEPELFKILGDIWLEFQSWPGHKEAAERIKKMLPPPLQNQDQQQDAAMQLEQAKAQMQQMQQVLTEMQKALETDKVKVDGQVQIKQIDADMKFKLANLEQEFAVKLQEMKDATAIDVKKLDLLGKGIVAAHQADDEELALGRQHAHEVVESEKDRQAQVEAAQMAQQHALEQGAQGALTDATMASQGHEQALEAGDVSHGQALEQQAQAAALAPQPAAGA